MNDTKTAVITVDAIHRDNERSLGFSGSGGRWNLRKKDHPNWGDIRPGKTLAVEYHTEPFEMNGRIADMKWVDHFEPVAPAQQPTPAPASHALPARPEANPSIEKQTIVKALAPLYVKDSGVDVDALVAAVNKVYVGVFADPLGTAMAQAKQVLGGEFDDEADEFAGTF